MTINMHKPLQAPADHFNLIEPGHLSAAQAWQAFCDVRSATEAFSERLSAEDQHLQSMPDASPIKWHRAHTSWFFETFLLNPYLPGYRSFDASYAYLFNSYYNAVGAQFPRAKRGLISRPGAEDISRFRAHVDQAIGDLLDLPVDAEQRDRIMGLFILGLNHEQQHQELMVTDIKHAFSHNPAEPAIAQPRTAQDQAEALQWLSFEGGPVHIGATGAGFHFDNEGPRHRVHLEPFSLADRPVSCGEFLDFINDGGYRRPELWLADAWAWVNEQQITAPLYWDKVDGVWTFYTLGGRRAVMPGDTICHLSFYEACAFAEWADARLPSEAEWEHASKLAGQAGTLADDGHYDPGPAPRGGDRLAALFGSVWEWTRSAYGPYPGFKPAAGAVGEYNGKFMANQMVLRGGSCATPPGHVRASYRNFFYPKDRWQFSGLRLARDLNG